MSTDKETLDNAFKDVGNVSGLTIFDAGPEGVVSRYLTERIRDGRVIGVNIWLEAYNKVRKSLGDELMEKLVFIKDDLRKIDYIKDNYFDLVVSYDTLTSVKTMTPDGTLPILHQFLRILKPGGLFMAIEDPSLKEMKPVNRAQELELEFRKLLCRIRKEEFGKGTYTPVNLSDMLKRIGFTGIYWKMVSQGHISDPDEAEAMIKGARNLVSERIQDEKERETVLEQIEELSCQTERAGFCEPPYYALYAKKPC